MKIIVTSKNNLKVNALKEVINELGISASVIPFEAKSGVREQPIGEEAKRGAENRINDVLSKNKDCDLVVSIESGLFFEENAWVDRAVIFVRNVKTNKDFILMSEGVEFPRKYVIKAKRQGYHKTTVGEVMEQEGVVKNRKDPHLDIAGITRKKIIGNAVLKMFQNNINCLTRKL